MRDQELMDRLALNFGDIDVDMLKNLKKNMLTAYLDETDTSKNRA
jgi:hypothetical protein